MNLTIPDSTPFIAIASFAADNGYLLEFREPGHLACVPDLQATMRTCQDSLRAFVEREAVNEKPRRYL